MSKRTRQSQVIDDASSATTKIDPKDAPYMGGPVSEEHQKAAKLNAQEKKQRKLSRDAARRDANSRQAASMLNQAKKSAKRQPLPWEKRALDLRDRGYRPFAY